MVRTITIIGIALILGACVDKKPTELKMRANSFLWLITAKIKLI